jgi:hypothetical protein
MTPAWNIDRVAEDSNKPDLYQGKGPDEPVIWFKQTIGNACGSIGMIHCLVNGPASENLQPGSFLAKLKADAINLGMEDRAKLLYDSQELELAHQSTAEMGDSKMPSIDAEVIKYSFSRFLAPILAASSESPLLAKFRLLYLHQNLLLIRQGSYWTAFCGFCQGRRKVVGAGGG